MDKHVKRNILLQRCTIHFRKRHTSLKTTSITFFTIIPISVFKTRKHIETLASETYVSFLSAHRKNFSKDLSQYCSRTVDVINWIVFQFASRTKNNQLGSQFPLYINLKYTEKTYNTDSLRKKNKVYKAIAGPTLLYYS